MEAQEATVTTTENRTHLKQSELHDLDLDLDLESFERLRYTVAKALSMTKQFKS
jgi:hypothetical protein